MLLRGRGEGGGWQGAVARLVVVGRGSAGQEEQQGEKQEQKQGEKQEQKQEQEQKQQQEQQQKQQQDEGGHRGEG